MAQNTVLLETITAIVKSVKGCRAILSEPFFINSSISTYEIYLNKANQRLYYIDTVSGEHYLLERQNNVVLHHLAALLSSMSPKQLRDNLYFRRRVDHQILEFIDLEEFIDGEMGLVFISDCDNIVDDSEFDY